MRRHLLAYALVSVLMIFALSSCSPATSAPSEPAVESRPTTGSEPSPTAGSLSVQESPSPTAQNSPTQEPSSPTTEISPTQEPPGDPTPGQAGELVPSPAYAIYVGMNQQGFCGSTTNSGWFEGFDFDSSFQNVRLLPPGPGNPYPAGSFSTGAGLPVRSFTGQGDVVSYAICPDYDPEPNPNSVTMGPQPFEPFLQIVPNPESAPVPLTGDSGPYVAIQFFMGSAAGGGPIMEWGSRIGKGVLGAQYDSFNVIFSVGWDSIMSGEEFQVGSLYQDEGEVQEWTMRFIPQGD